MVCVLHWYLEERTNLETAELQVPSWLRTCMRLVQMIPWIYIGPQHCVNQLI